mgnify:FL=1
MSTQPVEYVYALYNFDAENPDEVSFRVGERVLVVEKDDAYGDGWFQGTNERGETGLFPFSYTTYDESAAMTMLNGAMSRRYQHSPHMGSPTMGMAQLQQPEQQEPLSSTASPVTHASSPATSGMATNSHAVPDERGVMHSTMNDIENALSELHTTQPPQQMQPQSQDQPSLRNISSPSQQLPSDMDDPIERDFQARAAARAELARNARKSLQSQEPPWDTPSGVGEPGSISNARQTQSSSQQGVVPLAMLEMSDDSELDDDEDVASVGPSADPNDNRMNPSYPQLPTNQQRGMTPTSPPLSSLSLPQQQQQSPAGLYAGGGIRSPSASQPSHSVQSSHQEAISSQPPNQGTDVAKHTYSQSVSASYVPPRDPVLPVSEPQVPNRMPDASAAQEPADEPAAEATSDPLSWSIDDVVDWAISKGFDDQITNKLREHEVNGVTLLSLDIHTLREIDIIAYGRRFRVANCIDELRHGTPMSPSATSPRDASSRMPYNTSTMPRSVSATAAPLSPMSPRPSGTEMPLSPVHRDHQHAPVSPGIRSPSQLQQQQQQPMPYSQSTPKLQDPHALAPATERAPSSLGPPIQEATPGFSSSGAQSGDGSMNHAAPPVGLSPSIAGNAVTNPRSASPAMNMSAPQSAQSPGATAFAAPVPESARASAPGFGMPRSASTRTNNVPSQPLPQSSPMGYMRSHGNPLPSFGSGEGMNLNQRGPSPIPSASVAPNSAPMEQQDLLWQQNRQRVENMPPTMIPGGPQEQAGMTNKVVTPMPATPPVVPQAAPSAAPVGVPRDMAPEPMSATGMPGMPGTMPSQSPLPTITPGSGIPGGQPPSMGAPWGSQPSAVMPSGPGTPNRSGPGPNVPPMSMQQQGTPTLATPRTMPPTGTPVGKPGFMNTINSYGPSGPPRTALQSNPATGTAAATALSMLPYTKGGHRPHGLLTGTENHRAGEAGGGRPTERQTVLNRIGQIDRQGWIKKRGDRYNRWNSRYLVLHGMDLIVLRDPSADKVKNLIPLHGYKVVSDESAGSGFSFKIVHDTERTHHFSLDDEVALRGWMKAIMKATIGRDLSQPVISSYSNMTMTLEEAQRLRPRPPSPTSRMRVQLENARFNPGQLTSKDAMVLTSLDKGAN